MNIYFDCFTYVLTLIVNKHLGLLEDVESLLAFPTVQKSCVVHTVCLEKEACKKRALEA